GRSWSGRRSRRSVAPVMSCASFLIEADDLAGPGIDADPRLIRRILVRLRILLRRLALGCDHARIARLWLPETGGLQRDAEEPVVAIVEQEQQRVAGFRKGLEDAGFLDAEHPGVSLADVGKQLILRVDDLDLG